MNAQQHASSLNTATAYEIAAEWHDRQARGCQSIYEDDPRIEEKIRERARVAAVHHRASAASLRLAAVEIRRKAIQSSSSFPVA